MTTQQTNIERFNELTAKIFAALYASFPVRLALEGTDYGMDDTQTNDKGRSRFNNPEEAKFFLATVNWLLNAGYIDFTHLAGGFPGKAVLTAKGLEVLKAMPATLSTQESLGDLLVSGVKTGAKEALQKGVTYALSAGAAFAWQRITT